MKLCNLADDNTPYACDTNDLCPKLVSTLFCRTNTQTRSNAAFQAKRKLSIMGSYRSETLTQLCGII